VRGVEQAQEVVVVDVLSNDEHRRLPAPIEHAALRAVPCITEAFPENARA
jgi:hypothetical protein